MGDGANLWMEFPRSRPDAWVSIAPIDQIDKREKEIRSIGKKELKEYKRDKQ